MNQAKVIPLEISLHPGELCRKLGCLGWHIDRDRQQAVIESLLNQALSVVAGKVVYSIHTINKMLAGRMELAGCPPISGPVGNHLQPASRVVVFAATLGAEFENLVRPRLAHDGRIESSILQALADTAINAVVDAVADHLYWNELAREECLTPPLIPGCCGFDAQAVETLLSILDTRPIGLELMPGPCLNPALSTTGLIGIAPQSKIEEFGIPCAHCDISACRLRAEIKSPPHDPSDLPGHVIS
ncbi:MAG: hypothetical protein GXY44_13720 [Phycisphaerales bacterium]|nr:hypothetical protein [Phycisphaerales bacterium]